MQNDSRLTVGMVCCLILLLTLAVPASAADFLPTGVQSQLRDARMTPDLFRRLDAIGRDAQKHNIPVGQTLQRIWSDMDKPSIDAATRALKNHADIKKLLARHGLSAHQFVIGTLLLERSQFAAAGLIDKNRLDSGNLQFYNQHKEHADSVLAHINKASGVTAADNDPDAHDSTLKDLEELQKMDAQMLEECIEVSLVAGQAVYTFHMAYIATQHPELSGAGNIGSDDILGVSENLHDLLVDIPQRDLKGYVSTMSKEIEKQAYNRPIEYSPAYEQALAGYDAWGESHCSKEALSQ